MGVYPEVIRQALIMFPFLAFLITLPYMIYNYRKYGSVLGIRILVVYSFALYLLCIYFLVILPLPSMEEVSQMTGRRAQLIPFHFLADILKEADIVPGNICSLFSVLNEALFQVLFNVLMIVPFGIYLRYYFRCGLKRTVLFSFFLSLFFELTQLSGLYFIYPRGYRLFDVDDLIANTAGGALGYFIIQPFLKFLPSREKMDRASYGRGRRVSLSRRIFSLLTDGVCILVLYGICALICGRAGIALPGYIPALLVWSYFSLMTLLTGGKTVGKWLTRTCVAENSGKKNLPVSVFSEVWTFVGLFSASAGGGSARPDPSGKSRDCGKRGGDAFFIFGSTVLSCVHDLRSGADFPTETAFL